MNIDNNKSQEQDFILENMARTTQIMLPLQIELSKLSQALRPSAEAMESLAETMAEIMAEFGRPIQDTLKSLHRQQQRLAEFIESIGGLEKGVKESMLESGWWLVPSFKKVTPGQLLWAIKDHQSGDKLAIVDLFKEIYQQEDCRGLKDAVDSWRKNDLFLPWQNHITDALDSHINGKYTLSIPVILLVAEGIATDFCKKVDIYKEKENRSRGGEKIKKAVQKLYESEITNCSSLGPNSIRYIFSKTALDLLEEAINTMIYQNTDSMGEKLHTNILNRHAVMHGLKKNYGTVEASLRAFMLLDVLSLIE